MPGKPSVEVSIAVLASVAEHPRHAYEIWTTMRDRGHVALLGTSMATVYDAARRLERDGLLEIVGRHQVGRRPERTVYRPTEGGLDSLQSGVATLLTESIGDARRFEVALSFMFALAQRDVVARLSERLAAVAREIASGEARIDRAKSDGVALLFLCEQDYGLTLLRCELAWVRDLVAWLSGVDVGWPVPSPVTEVG